MLNNQHIQYETKINFNNSVEKVSVVSSFPLEKQLFSSAKPVRKKMMKKKTKKKVDMMGMMS